MTQPSGEQVQASIEALHQDAGVWARQAADLDAMAQIARGLTLSAFDVSGLGHLAGLDTTYTALQERVAGLIEQAATNFDAIADTLHAVADDYDRDERDGVHRLRNIY